MQNNGKPNEKLENLSMILSLSGYNLIRETIRSLALPLYQVKYIDPPQSKQAYECASLPLLVFLISPIES